MDKIKNKLKENKPKKPLIFYYVIVIVVIYLFNALLGPSIWSGTAKTVSYSTFLNMIENKQVETVEISSDYIYFISSESENNHYKTLPVQDLELVDRLTEAGVEFGAAQPDNVSPILGIILGYVLPFAIFGIIGKQISKNMTNSMGALKGGIGNNPMMSFGKSNAKRYIPSQTGIKFSDVAGEDEAKELLTELVSFLHDPKKYKDIGAKMPKGALLVGPPGTGKTLLAKAVAGEADVPFFSIAGSEFVEMFVGMGASKVRDLFDEAEKNAPCIVFIDEIDTIGKKRDGSGLTGNDEREQTLNQLLTEMDGFDSSKGVLILAATNRPDTLDPALLRPGRFDRRIPVELPDLQGREEILKVHLKNVKHQNGINLSAIAKASAGASGADLANMVNEAALRAVRVGKHSVDQSDLEESVEVVLAGYKKKNQIMTEKEKMIVSYHETGHALVAALQNHSAPVTKITIIPRTSGALGYTMQVEEDNKVLYSRTELENKITTLCGGRAAEDLIFNSVTTGAANDIEQATKIARAMVTNYGMSDQFGMVSLQTTNNAYLGGDSTISCSPQTAKQIDDQVVEIVKNSYNGARKILADNISKLHELARVLYEEETITGDRFMEILDRPVAID